VRAAGAEYAADQCPGGQCADLALGSPDGRGGGDHRSGGFGANYRACTHDRRGADERAGGDHRGRR
jgi:hypothetical protein